MRVLVDADVMAYAGGFATQKTIYDVMAVLPDGEVHHLMTPLQDEITAWIMILPRGTEIDITPVVEAEPLVNALALCKRTLLGIESAFDAAGHEFKHLELFLTGKGNYRDSIATIKGYKANRVGKEKPVHYKAIRRYMVERWDAVTVEGYEADDAVAMEAHILGYDPARVCIVSMDKDLRTVPGLLYNFKRKKFYTITENEALCNFYLQALTGDVVDNIGGCFKCGEKGASEIVRLGMSEEEMYQAVLAEYEASVKRKGCPYVGLGAAAALLENCQLLHMMRWKGQRWSPASVRDMNDRSVMNLPAEASLGLMNLKSSGFTSESLAADAAIAALKLSSDGPPTFLTSKYAAASPPASGTSRPKASSRRPTASGSKPSKPSTPPSLSGSSSSGTTG